MEVPVFAVGHTSGSFSTSAGDHALPARLDEETQP